MKKDTVQISDRTCTIYKSEHPEYLLIQPIDEHDLEVLDNEVATIESLTNKSLATSVYLSLGDKEEKTKNPTMAQVGNCIRKQQELLTAQGINTILEWNPGNHFQHSDERTAKGFAWVINHIWKLATFCIVLTSNR